MNSERILSLASLVAKDDIVLDVGCDHGYLGIYLKENNLCKEVYASDISANALNSARDNFKKHKLDIKSFVSDGFNNVDVKFNTAVISGMGTSTIINILSSEKRPDKLILSSHNDLYKLRKHLNKIGYKLEKELIIYENNHYYSIMLYVQGSQKLNKRLLKYGISYNHDYYKYLYNKNIELLKKVPFKKKLSLIYDNYLLKKLIEKK